MTDAKIKLRYQDLGEKFPDLVDECAKDCKWGATCDCGNNEFAVNYIGYCHGCYVKITCSCGASRVLYDDES